MNLPWYFRGDERRWRQAGQWVLVLLMFASYWYFAPTLKRAAEAVPMPVAVAFLASYVCLAFATDVFQIVDPTLLLSRVRGWTGWRPSHDSTVFIESEVRRKWFRALGRLHILSFILGTTILGVVMHAFGAMRPMLLIWWGQGNTTLIFGVASFGSFLLSVWLFLAWFGLHPRYRCPHCGEYLSDSASISVLNRDSRCRHCQQGVPIAPCEAKALRMDLFAVGAGMFLLIVFLCALT